MVNCYDDAPFGGGLATEEPNLIIVPGDTNSTLAGALTGVKMDIPVAQVETGARSYDMRMCEEVNRRVVDHISSILFAPTRNCAENLRRESVLDKVFEVGDTMYDVLLRWLPPGRKVFYPRRTWA